MGRLNGKVAIITGAAGGMGASHARKFIDEGAKVVLADIMEEQSQDLADELGENAIFMKLDVTNAEDWERVVADTEETFGPISVLVNNAGITLNKSIEDITVDDYHKVFNINQLSVFLGIKTVSPSMKKTDNGSIVNISSMNGLVGGAIGYTDTKFAVRGMTKAAALSLAPDGIRVNSVHPGVIETPMLTQGDTKDAVEEFAKHIPNRRIAKPEEVSNMVLFLASDESSYSTGSEFVIDGGLTAQ
ncbi:3-alpha-(or 20-beta)-hydroxysteroid dehydrogenase [Lentibacillus kapialis]|uniref:3-alpha-(Or 20-beta)-hydroxysteroid dehydrogenase n=1 Tax=Lentibacillus kapialis TaxID=340214 RepID=A0A917UX74_9BACI|nr:glucose 1-dehydrogenase [Lentibacillus kapialis]GGJ93937.1 3-alpha-(or 20-beta)-hydroxysteroid dehydrogenase [Lentibacillus kapialis]